MSNLNAKKGALFGNKAGSSSTGGKTSTSTTVNNTTSATKQPKTTGMTSKATGTTISNEVKLKKINEAKEWSEKGMKFLKTSVFQWEPDHLAAAPCFEKSAAAYKAAGEDELARKLLLQSAISCEKSNTLSSGALALVKASEIAKSQGNIDYVIQDLEKAAELYGIDGKIDSCADIYFKIGKAIQGNKKYENDNIVLPYFYKAINLLCPEDTPKQNLDKVIQEEERKPRTLEEMAAEATVLRTLFPNNVPNF
jgi:tetratricopeptide (TPR) repeat protein